MNEEIPIQQKKKRFRRKKKKNKLVLVFDENARREFLTGFRKRKMQRKLKAKEELEKQLKEERKRLKAEAKEEYKKLLLAQKPIPELEDLLSEEIDMGTHSVSITELSTADLAKKNHWIGVNEMQYEEKGVEDVNQSETESQNNDELEGMEMNSRSKKKEPEKSTMKNCKDIKKAIRKKATLNVKKSKVYQKKSQMEKIRFIKKKRRQERQQQKLKKLDKKSKYKQKFEK